MSMLIKAISITSYNSILFKAINAARNAIRFTQETFAFIFPAPLRFLKGGNTLCETVSI